MNIVKLQNIKLTQRKYLAFLYTNKEKTEKLRKQLHSPLMLSAAKSLQSYLTLCDPIDGSPPGSLIPGVLQARTLEWVAISMKRIKYLGINLPKETKTYI